MRLVLPSGQTIGTDRLISGFFRTDCTPIVASLEFQCTLDEDLDAALHEGSTVTLGDQYIEFTIIKRRVVSGQFIKDGKPINVGAYIALLAGMEKLIEPSVKAIFLKDSTIGAAFRASGNKLKVAEDVPLLRYFCPLGATPTYEIARKFQEEAATAFCNLKGQIIVKRLSNITDGEAKLTVDRSAVNWIENSTQLNHDMPNFVTLNPDGSTLEGTLKPGVKTGFYPGLDARRLKNLSTALVTRGTLMRAYTPDILAGDVVQVGDKKYSILTAVSRFDTGILGGSSVSATKFWLAEVVSL